MAATEAGSARRRCNRSALTSTNTVGPAGIEPATRGLKVACGGERRAWSEGRKPVRPAVGPSDGSHRLGPVLGQLRTRCGLIRWLGTGPEKARGGRCLLVEPYVGAQAGPVAAEGLALLETW